MGRLKSLSFFSIEALPVLGMGEKYLDVFIIFPDWNPATINIGWHSANLLPHCERQMSIGRDKRIL